MTIQDISIPSSLINQVDNSTLEVSGGKAQIKDSGVDTDQIKDDAVTDAKADLTIVPVGAVLSWLKDYTNTPALSGDFVECNGQTLSDADSVFNGQVIPDLNGDARFLYGHSASGSTKTEDFLPTHKHNLYMDNAADNALDGYPGSSSSSGDPCLNASGGTAWAGYSVVMIMRIK